MSEKNGTKAADKKWICLACGNIGTFGNGFVAPDASRKGHCKCGSTNCRVYRDGQHYDIKPKQPKAGAKPKPQPKPKAAPKPAARNPGPQPGPTPDVLKGVTGDLKPPTPAAAKQAAEAAAREAAGAKAT